MELDERCEKCNFSDSLRSAIFSLLLVVNMLIFHFALNSKLTEKMSSAGVTCTTFGSLITVQQLSGAIMQAPLGWPKAMVHLRDMLRLFTMDFRFLRTACFLGGEPVTEFYTALLAPVSVAVVFFGLAGFSRQFLGRSRYAMRRDDTWNTFGTMYQAVFITIALFVMSPFQCYNHPHEESSLMQRPDVICWSEEHATMVLGSVVFMLLAMVPYLLYYAYTIVQLPRWSTADVDYYRSVKFIIYRFRAGAWYWGLIFLIRNTLIAVASVLAPTEPYRQLLIVLVLLLVGLALQCVVWPWRTTGLNVVDSGVVVSLCVLIATAMAYLGELESDTEDEILWVSLFSYISACSIVLIYLLYAWYTQIMDSFSATYRKKQKEKDKTKNIRMLKRLLLCMYFQNQNETEKARTVQIGSERSHDGTETVHSWKVCMDSTMYKVGCSSRCLAQGTRARARAPRNEKKCIKNEKNDVKRRAGTCPFVPRHGTCPVVQRNAACPPSGNGMPARAPGHACPGTRASQI